MIILVLVTAAVARELKLADLPAADVIVAEQYRCQTRGRLRADVALDGVRLIEKVLSICAPDLAWWGWG